MGIWERIRLKGRILGYKDIEKNSISEDRLDSATSTKLNTVGNGGGTTDYNALTNKPTIDTTPTNGSINAVSSDGVFDALALKEPSITPGSSSQVLLGNKALSSLKSVNGNSLLGSGDILISGGSSTVRVVSITSNATPTPNADITDLYVITALAANATIGLPTGTPLDGQKLSFRIKDNNVARTLGWNAGYRPIGVTLPLTTIAGKLLYGTAYYNGVDSVWDVLSIAQQA